MDIHVYYTCLIVIGLLCLLTAALIWAFFVATDTRFDAVVAANTAADQKLGLTPKANPGEVMHQVHGQKKPVRRALPDNQVLLVRKTPAWIDSKEETKSWK